MKWVVQEDKTVQNYRAECTKRVLHALIPRVAVIGFSISIIAALTLNAYNKLESSVFWMAIFAPTTIMLAYLYWGPLAISHLERRRWKFSKKKVATHDGFRAPLQGISAWGQTACEELPGYTQFSIQINHRYERTLIVKDGSDADALKAFFQERAIPETLRAPLKPTACTL